MALNKSEVVAAVAAHTNLSQAAVNGVLDALFATISAEIAQGGKVTIPGFLSVERTSRAGRVSRNPHTGATSHIPPRHPHKISH